MIEIGSRTASMIDKIELAKNENLIAEKADKADNAFD